QGVGTVRSIDARDAAGAHAVRVQENHQFANAFLHLPAFAHALQAAGAESADLCQKRGALINDLQRFFAKDVDDFFGVVRTDSLDEARAKVANERFAGVGRRGVDLVGLELQAAVAIVHPGTLGLDRFARAGLGHGTDDGHLASALGEYAQ